MLKKRIIAVITISDNLVVQSFNYNKILPLGKPEIFLENFNRWNADEIIINDISRSRNKLGPNFDLIKKIGKMKISTPITYMGGISNFTEANRVINLGFERIAVDKLFHENPDEIVKIAKNIGSQAIIISMPVQFKNNSILQYDYILKKTFKLEEKKIFKFRKYFSEIMIADYKNEGDPNAFDLRLIKKFKSLFNDIKILPFGGISENTQLFKILSLSNTSGVCISNFLSYTEHSIQKYKLFLEKKKINCIRPPEFEKNFI